jgi:hypothetical protein
MGGCIPGREQKLITVCRASTPRIEAGISLRNIAALAANG